MGSTAIRILIVDDHEMVRRGLSSFLRTSADFLLVGEAKNGQEAIDQCAILQPDVVLMDLIMPGTDGLTAIAHIRERFPKIKIIALSSASDAQTISAAIKSGAAGYIIKNVSTEELAAAIRTAFNGGRIFSQEATEALIESASQPSEPVYQFTDRELEVLRALVAGKNNIEIAQAIFLSRSTVKYYVSRIIAKLGVSNRSEAIVIAINNHIV
jgi:DNA-binding NarL/FixJ family response regulator